MDMQEIFDKAKSLGATGYSVFSIKKYIYDQNFEPFSYAFFTDETDNGMRLEIAHYSIPMHTFEEFKRWNAIDVNPWHDVYYRCSGLIKF